MERVILNELFLGQKLKEIVFFENPYRAVETEEHIKEGYPSKTNSSPSDSIGL